MVFKDTQKNPSIFGGANSYFETNPCQATCFGSGKIKEEKTTPTVNALSPRHLHRHHEEQGQAALGNLRQQHLKIRSDSGSNMCLAIVLSKVVAHFLPGGGKKGNRPRFTLPPVQTRNLTWSTLHGPALTTPARKNEGNPKRRKCKS